jgi:hypothetical protein
VAQKGPVVAQKGPVVAQKGPVVAQKGLVLTQMGLLFSNGAYFPKRTFCSPKELMAHKGQYRQKARCVKKTGGQRKAVVCQMLRGSESLLTLEYLKGQKVEAL